MSTVLFTNFTQDDFIGYWDGKPTTVKSGKSIYLPDYLAKHFAKHLVNRELIRTKADGTPVYVNGAKFTSPKFPEQVPSFMELFNKAYKETETEENEIEAEVETIVDTLNKNNQIKKGRGRPKKEQGEQPTSDTDEFAQKPIE